jgi:hypothetical protein
MLLAMPATAQNGDAASDAVKRASEVDPESSGSRFSAKIEIDTRQPVSYGSDVNISVWITPVDSMRLNQVRIHPKGMLAAIYRSTEEIPKDLREEGGDSIAQGVSCKVSEQSPRPGIPFVATCELESLENGWNQWFDPAVLIDSGRQRFEVEISLQDGPGAITTYHEIGTVEFVSPKAAVVLGGFIGALILSFLTFVARPTGSAPVLTSWREFGDRLWKASPQNTASLGFAAWDIIRRALLGGVTATVLIILAKSSEGFEAPISLQIQDFWGGLLVGLVSVNLANWVLKKLDGLVQ